MPSGPSSGNMRDRRNVNLSISSTGSFVSCHTSPIASDNAQDNAEKGRYLWIPPRDDNGPLPSPLLKHARESQYAFLDRWPATPKLRRILVMIVLAIGSVCYLFSPSLGGSTQLQAVLSHVTNEIDLINGETIPKEPTTLIFKDKQANLRWTVSIPTTNGFPLEPKEYRQICEAVDGAKKSVESMQARSRIHGKPKDHLWERPFYTVDKTFLPVAEAENQGFLPSMPQGQDHVNVVGRTNDSLTGSPTCDSSLTFAMHTDSAGFGNTLLALWLSYGLAQKEGRAFFIDDTNWAYGRYSSYFKLPPQPACAAPPANQILPCPHYAHHLVVSAATLPWTFGPAFKDEYQNAFKYGFKKNRRIYDLIRKGYEDLFSLAGEDQGFLDHQQKIMRDAATAAQTPLIGMHIRRGDLHPFEVEYSNDYLPYERYTHAASELFSSLHPNKSSSEPTGLLLASDDPDTTSSPDLLNTLPSHLTVVRPQERIVLASKRNLEPAVPIREPGSAYVKHVDENSGWEGGFYASLFFALGRGHPSAGQDMDEEMQKAVLELREFVGRAYLLDLAVLSRTDAVVCASSSAACRLMAVMMGDDAVSRGRWKNVDSNRAWSWDGL